MIKKTNNTKSTNKTECAPRYGTVKTTKWFVFARGKISFKPSNAKNSDRQPFE